MFPAAHGLRRVPLIRCNAVFASNQSFQEVKVTDCIAHRATGTFANLKGEESVVEPEPVVLVPASMFKCSGVVSGAGRLWGGRG